MHKIVVANSPVKHHLKTGQSSPKVQYPYSSFLLMFYNSGGEKLLRSWETMTNNLCNNNYAIIIMHTHQKRESGNFVNVWQWPPFGVKPGLSKGNPILIIKLGLLYRVEKYSRNKLTVLHFSINVCILGLRTSITCRIY